MKLFAVECQYYIEDYYRAYSIEGVYDTREAAEAQIDAQLQAFRRKNLESAIFSELEEEEYLNYPEYQIFYEKMQALRETFPKFDQTRQKDKEYVKEHTAKKHAIKEQIAEIDSQRHAIWKYIYDEVTKKVAQRMENVDRVERFYNEIDLDTYYGKFDAMRVKELELNKPMPQSTPWDYD